MERVDQRVCRAYENETTLSSFFQAKSFFGNGDRRIESESSR